MVCCLYFFKLIFKWFVIIFVFLIFVIFVNVIFENLFLLIKKYFLFVNVNVICFKSVFFGFGVVKLSCLCILFVFKKYLLKWYFCIFFCVIVLIKVFVLFFIILFSKYVWILFLIKVLICISLFVMIVIFLFIKNGIILNVVFFVFK